MQAHAYIIKAFEGTNTGGADCDALCSVGKEAFDGSTWHGYPFSVHGVTRDFLALHRFESSCAYMEGNLVAFDAARIEILQYFFGKMQTCSGGSHRPLDARVDSLVSIEVALFCVAIQIGRNGQFTDAF